MGYRAARTLAFTTDQGALVGCNYLQKTTFQCAPELLAVLGRLDDWSPAGAVADALDPDGAEPAETLIDQLVACGVLLRQASPEARREDAYEKGWEWALPAALLHFSVQDNPPIPVERLEQIQLEKARTVPQPELVRRHDRLSEAVALPPTVDDDGPLALMARRRTQRAVRRAPISAAALADCLYAGVGVVGYTSNKAGALPLTMTPSGGARNPYEAFVLVRRVEDIAPGLYHYGAADRSLLPICSDETTRAGTLLGDQHWMDDMACVVFLCARLGRTMWKYSDPNAYRVVLIEAGHIGQNIMLAATGHGLTACPTAALAHRAIADLCRLDDPLLDAPVYALGLGVPDPDRQPEADGAAASESFPL